MFLPIVFYISKHINFFLGIDKCLTVSKFVGILLHMLVQAVSHDFVHSNNSLTYGSNIFFYNYHQIST